MHSGQQNEFWDSMCHELRTPLTAILGISSILMTPCCPPQRQGECVAVLRDSAAMLKSLIDNMLDYARFEAGRMELCNEPFSPAMAISEAACIAGMSAEAKGLSLQVHIGQLPLQLTGDALRIRQIALNLLANAIKFTSDGYVRLEAWAEPVGFGTHEITIRVTDSGIGIAPDRLERIFERFKQADESINHRYGGSGLGLTICRELAWLMGGTILAESTQGEGSCFTVTLHMNSVQIPLVA